MKLNLIAVLLLFVFALATQSCQKNTELSGGEGDNTNEGSFNGGTSHNMGKNCMNCHKSGGQGEGIFTVAGTVYDAQKTNTFSNATVKLFTGTNGTGTLKYTFQADTRGNFYTTGNVTFGSGLFPAVQGKSSTNYMSSAITTGQCNSCHGASQDRIWAQ